MDHWDWRKLRNEAAKLSEDELERYSQVLSDVIIDLEGLECWKKDRNKNPIKELRLNLTIEYETVEDELEHKKLMRERHEKFMAWKKIPKIDEEEAEEEKTTDIE